MRTSQPSSLTTRLASAALAATLTLLAACGGDSNDPSPSIAIAVAPTSLSFAQGESKTAAVTITRSGGFAAPVNLTASGAPAGMTVSFAPASVAATATTSTVTVAASGTVAPGTYPITVRANGQGVSEKTAQISVVVAAQTTPAYTLTLSPASLTVEQGKTDSARIQLARAGGFTGAVTLAASGAPEGVAVTIPTSPAPGDTSTVKVAVAATVAPGNYPITITGTAPDLTDRTATLSLTVSAPQPAAGITIAVDPTAVTVQAGGAAVNSVATITRTGNFTGAVAITATGAPAGLTVSADPASVTGTSSTITFQAAASATPGTYNVVVRATGTGVAEQTATVAVTITAPPTGGTSVVLPYCPDDVPLWLAMQDGSGAWTRVNPNTTNNTFTVTLASGQGGFASVDTVGEHFELDVFYMSLQELQQFAANATATGCDDGIVEPGTGKTVNGSVANVGGEEIASISLGGSSAGVFAASGTLTFELKDVPEGAHDLIASRATLATLTPNKFIIRRGINPANGSTLPVLDFNAAEAFAPTTSQATIAGVGGDEATLYSSLTTANGSSAFFGIVNNVQDGAVGYVGLPSDKLVAGDLQQAVVSAQSPGDGPDSRYSAFYFTSVANRTLTLGPKLAPAVTSIGTTPTLRLRTVLPVQSVYDLFASADYSQDNGNEASIAMTSGYRGSATSWTLEMPDLSGLEGWQNSWGLAAGTPVAYSVSAYGGFFSLIAPGMPTDGTTYHYASHSGEFGGTVSRSLMRQNADEVARRYLSVVVPPKKGRR